MSRPHCNKCGYEMTPESARIHPELFLHDACLPNELKPVAELVGGCPTCSHTLQALFGIGGRMCFWCPRCGTLRITSGDHTDDEAPKLVARCRKFEATIGGVCAEHAHQWHALGIREAINVSANRPPH